MKNAFCHIEIMTTNLKRAEKFYGDLFEWKIQSGMMGEKYSLYETPQAPGGGIAEMPQVNPGDSIMVYVEVDDLPAYLKKAESLGGKQVTPKTDIPNIGWYGVLADPDGNKMGLFTPLPK